MKLFSHLLSTDARQFRWTILAWVVLLSAEGIASHVLPSVDTETRVGAGLQLSASLLWFTVKLMTIVLVPVIVQAHPAVGTRAFWMTRPIPPPALVAAKAVLVFALAVATPGAIELVQMRADHMPAPEAIRVGAQSALLSALFVAALMAAAAVTANLTRFALLLGGCVATVAVYVVVLTTLAAHGAFDTVEFTAVSVGSGFSPPTTMSDETKGFIAALGAIGAALLTVAVQYRTRLRRYSIPLGIAALVLTWAVTTYWPWPLLRIPSAVPVWAEDPRRVHPVALASDVSFDERMQWARAGDSWRTARMKMHLEGLEPGWMATVKLTDASISLDRGVTLRNSMSTYPAAVPIDSSDEPPDRVVARRLLGTKRLAGSRTPRADTAIAFLLRESEFDRYAPATGTYRGQFQIELIRSEIVGTLPLHIGATFQDGAYRLTILDVTSLPRVGPVLRVRLSTAGSIFDRVPRHFYEFFARNRQRSEAVAATMLGAGDQMTAVMGFGFSSHGTGFSHQGVRLIFTPPYVAQSEEEVVTTDSRWFSEAELVVERSTPVGRVTRSIELPGFVLKEPPVSERPR